MAKIQCLPRIALLSILVASLVSACGGGGGGGQNDVEPSSPPPKDPVTISGAVAGVGYLDGATVFSDQNGNLQLDVGEPSTSTTAGGAYSLTGIDVDLYPVVVSVDKTATDEETGPVTAPYLLTAPKDASSFISPLTTLFQLYVEKNPALNWEQAEEALAVRGGLSPEKSLIGPTSDYIISSDQQLREIAQLVIAAFVQLRQQVPAEAGSFGEGTLDRLVIATTLDYLPDLAFEDLKTTIDASTFDAGAIATFTTSGLLDSLEEVSQGIAVLDAPMLTAFQPDIVLDRVLISGLPPRLHSFSGDGSLTLIENVSEQVGSWSIQEDGALILEYADGLTETVTLLADRSSRLLVHMDIYAPNGDFLLRTLNEFVKTEPFSESKLAGNVYALDNGSTLTFANDGTGWASLPPPMNFNDPYQWEVNNKGALAANFLTHIENDTTFLLAGGSDEAFRVAIYGYDGQDSLLGFFLSQASLVGALP